MTHNWEKAKAKARREGNEPPPEPGTVDEPEHGIPGPAEPRPKSELNEPTGVNEYD